jgi:L-histidine Nalpha-methyltransferase
MSRSSSLEAAWAAPEEPGVFLRDVLEGLSLPRKSLPCKYFYDSLGSQLFEQICGLPEYYPTRTELAIMRSHVTEMAELLGPRVCVVEPGSGASTKTRLLLERLQEPLAYVPVEISGDALAASTRALRARFPAIDVVPVTGDFTQPFGLPAFPRHPDRVVVFFPGSTIGNFEPPEASAFLRRMGELIGPDGGLLIGVDLHKPAAILEPAYDDAAGVTARFNRNVLLRINRELGADFRAERFAHRALYNRSLRRIEMYLESERHQTATIAGRAFHFAPGERIHTESSYKYTVPSFQRLAERSGLLISRVWTDDRRLFSVHYLEQAS